MEESIGINGRLDWVLFDEHGIKKESGTSNQVQDKHKINAALRMSAATATYNFTYMWVGGTGGIPSTASTNLIMPIASGRQGVTSVTPNPGAGSTVVIATLAAGVGTGTLTSAGLFNKNIDASKDGMQCCAAIAVTKAAGDSLTLTWTVNYS
jgi:hypothetical protein